MPERGCGGCQGLGSHWRWCPELVGHAASMYGRLAQQAEDLGDQIGPNDTAAANACYSAAGSLNRKAKMAKIRHMESVVEQTRRLDNLEGLGE